MPDLSFPIGKFQPPASGITDADRSQAIDEISTLPSKLRAAVSGLSEAQLNTPYRPDGWTVRQLVHHIADSHMNGYIRHKLTLTENQPLIKPYDQPAWAELEDSKAPVETSLKLIDALHERWTMLLRSVPRDGWSRKYNHPEHAEPLALETSVCMYGWHSAHHTAHITALRQREGW